ncbi:hypothetical protein [Caloranaerobacter azorensis]|uniref:Uncharacterized protein n=1 Tax=Caloranaerobacter azorensis TaxID=116090 RepID=A0A6P1YCM9_9FIRM|nr:hypothetical protein [Caloranaerobacter azorensis]QIB26817.1 hypothetical protein G3A45_05580 [Caloranaerobacter azorensis]
MKGKYQKIILVCLIIVIAVYIFYTFPREYDVAFQGIKYRLKDTSYQEKVEVRIKGWYTKKVFLGNRFKGEIYLGDKKFLNVDLKLNKYNSDILMGYREEIGEFRMYGKIYLGNNLDKVAILLFEPVNSDYSKSYWSSKDGLMISAPAKNRVEAISLSKELIKSEIIKYDNL